MNGLAAGESHDGGPEREVRCGDEDFVAVLHQRLYGHGDQFGDTVAEEDVVHADLQAPVLVALGDGTAGGQDTARVRVAVRPGQHPDHVLEDLLGCLESEEGRVAGVQAQHAVTRRLQCVGLLDHRAADLVTDLAEFARLPELHALRPPVVVLLGFTKCELGKSNKIARLRRMSPRRSYDQYCSAARALDAVGDRWTLLIVRELLGGPRRYTDLHADLPGVSTDVLASRLKDMERDGLTTRRRLPPPGAAYVYELTARGHELLPVLHALGEWGAHALGERRPTDAVRAHWFALPLLRGWTRPGPGRGSSKSTWTRAGSMCGWAPGTGRSTATGSHRGSRTPG